MATKRITTGDELIKALVEAGYKSARFLLVSTKSVNLMVEPFLRIPANEKDAPKNASRHPVIEYPKDTATGRHKLETILRTNGIGFTRIRHSSPRLVAEDVKMDVGQATLAPDAVPPPDEQVVTESVAAAEVPAGPTKLE